MDQLRQCSPLRFFGQLPVTHPFELLVGDALSDRRLSMLATGSTDTVRNIRRGSNPRTDTLEAICGVLGLEIYLGPPQDNPGPEPPAPPEILDALGLAEGASLKDAVETIEQRLSWRSLYRQFGVDPSRASDNVTVQRFRKSCLRELKKIKLAWPDLN